MIDDPERLVPFDFSSEIDFTAEIDLSYTSRAIKKLEATQITPKFDELPVNILENIFVFLPTRDILQSLTLTCRRFNSIISDADFLAYKKLFSLHRAGHLPEDSEYFSIFNRSTEENCFVELAKLDCIKNFRKSVKVVERPLHKRIENFVSYVVAKQFLEKFTNEKTPFYSYLGMLLLIVCLFLCRLFNISFLKH